MVGPIRYTGIEIYGLASHFLEGAHRDVVGPFPFAGK